MKGRHVRVQHLLIVVAVAIVGVVMWAVWPATPISQANFERIATGMTDAEVYTILGGPPRNEATGVLRDSENTKGFARIESGSLWLRNDLGEGCIWLSDNAVVHVEFDDTGHVVRKEFMEVSVERESVLSRLRRWLRI